MISNIDCEGQWALLWTLWTRAVNEISRMFHNIQYSIARIIKATSHHPSASRPFCTVYGRPHLLVQGQKYGFLPQNFRVMYQLVLSVVLVKSSSEYCDIVDSSTVDMWSVIPDTRSKWSSPGIQSSLCLCSSLNQTHVGQSQITGLRLAAVCGIKHWWWFAREIDAGSTCYMHLRKYFGFLFFQHINSIHSIYFRTS